MSLRNKKTGKIIDGCFVVCEYDDGERFSVKDKPVFNSLAELCEEWEDYVPTEPLIKDERIRKVIRAWAEANDATELRYDVHENSLTDIYRNTISFNYGLVGLKDGHSYTIEELCGTPPEPIEPKFIDLDGRIKEKEEE